MQVSDFIQQPVQITTTPKSKTPFNSEDNTSAQKAVQAALSLLNTNCVSAINTVNSLPLGPYSLKGSCTYDCSYEQKWWWNPDYRYVNSNIDNVISGLNMKGYYGNPYELTLKWLQQTLPKYNATITDNFALINKIDAAIIAAGGTETPTQKTQLSTAFTTIYNTLKANLDEANLVFKAIATFELSQKSNIGYLQTQVKSYQSSIQTSATNAENDLLGKIACGAGDVKAQFNTMLAEINTKIASMQPSFNAVSSSFLAAINAISKVAGVFLILQSDSELVSNALEKAQKMIPGPLRHMNLNIALENWNDLLSEVNTQLAP